MDHHRHIFGLASSGTIDLRSVSLAIVGTLYSSA